VEIHDDEFERRNAERVELLAVICKPEVCEKSSMHCGVQGLHAAVKRLLKARHLCNVCNLHAKVADALCGGTGGNDFDTSSCEATSELLETGLVTHRNECPSHGHNGPVLIQVRVFTLYCHGGSPHTFRHSIMGYVFKHNRSGRDIANRLEQQWAFDRFDALVKFFLGFPGTHTHRRLADDRSGIDSSVD